MFGNAARARLGGSLDGCPWGATTGRHVQSVAPARRTRHDARPLYTPEEKLRRDSSIWTLVQGVLAPAQFAVFLISLGFVLHYLITGRGELAANVSVLAKTCVLYTIMITGAVWEKDIFGRYLFAPAFFWEDAMSMIVVGLHTAYVVALLSHALDAQHLMLLALTAYACYVVNAAQFLLKLRAARLAEQDPWHQAAHSMRQA